MACTSAVLNGLANDCSSSLGGVKRVWISPYVDNAATVSGDTVSITGNTTNFKAYYFRVGAASMTKTLNVNAEAGSSYVSTVLSMSFSRMETKKRIEMTALSLGDLMVVVEDNNGKVWFLGKDAPVKATAGGGETGAAKSDANRYNIELTDESLDYPYELDAASVTAIKSIDYPEN